MVEILHISKLWGLFLTSDCRKKTDMMTFAKRVAFVTGRLNIL